MVQQYVTFPLSVKVIYEAESGEAPYVAYAPELDVSSCGPTEEKARRNLGEVVQILFEEAQRKGKLSELLEEAGFRKHRRSWLAPRVSFEQVAVSLKANGDFDAKDFSYPLS